MELKNIVIFLIFYLFINSANAELVKPDEKLGPYDVVKNTIKCIKKK